MNDFFINSKYLAVIALAVSGALVPFLSFAASIEEVRMWQAPDHTRLVFGLSDAVSYNLFTLEDPYRVVIDIENSELGDDLSGLDFTTSPIEGMRTGVRNGQDLRIVLDLNTETNPTSFTLAPNSELGNRLVVDLYNLDSAV